MHHSPQNLLLLPSLTDSPIWRLICMGMLAYKYWQAQVAQTAALNNADTSTTDGWAAPATVPWDAPHRPPADWKALASAVEECTDLRLPWLNRERGSCFIQGQKESTKEGVAPCTGGAGPQPHQQISIRLCRATETGRMGGCLWGAVAKESHCKPAHTH